MAIVLDFDQTITLNCPNSKLTIRGANDAFNMLQTLKDRGAELAIITAQNPSKIAAKGVEDELNHLGATLKIHNAFEIFKNTKFISGQEVDFYGTKLYRYHNVFCSKYNKPEAMREFLNTSSNIKYIIFIDDNMDNALNMYTTFVGLEDYHKSVNKQFEMHSFWYEPAVKSENINEKTRKSFEKYVSNVVQHKFTRNKQTLRKKFGYLSSC